MLVYIKYSIEFISAWAAIIFYCMSPYVTCEEQCRDRIKQSVCSLGMTYPACQTWIQHKDRAGCCLLYAASTPLLSIWQAIVKACQKYMVIIIELQSSRKKLGLAQPGYNANLFFCQTIQLRNVCFSQMCSPVPLLSVTVDQRLQKEPRGCQFLSFSKPAALMVGQCDPATLFVLHDYCV